MKSVFLAIGLSSIYSFITATLALSFAALAIDDDPSLEFVLTVNSGMFSFFETGTVLFC